MNDIRVDREVATYIYRGVSGNHPRLAEARLGLVIPGNLAGVVTPLEHNEGGRQAESPYTSWTYSLRIARDYARRVRGGLVLRVPAGSPDPTDRWHWEWSPDEFHEDEILLHGIRMDAEVIE